MIAGVNIRKDDHGKLRGIFLIRVF